MLQGKKRTAGLQVDISEPNKKWLLKLKKELGRPMGDVVDEILTRTRTEKIKKK